MSDDRRGRWPAATAEPPFLLPLIDVNLERCARRCTAATTRGHRPPRHDDATLARIPMPQARPDGSGRACTRSRLPARCQRSDVRGQMSDVRRLCRRHGAPSLAFGRLHPLLQRHSVAAPDARCQKARSRRRISCLAAPRRMPASSDIRHLSSDIWMVGLGRFERPTSRLSGVRSNQLSYRPPFRRQMSDVRKRAPEGPALALRCPMGLLTRADREPEGHCCRW
jgi:hypothetical protein